MEKKINRTAHIGRIVWLYIKYQFITKGLLAIIIFPLASWVMNYLLQTTGRTNISSGDYLSFLFSPQGVGMLILGLVLIALLIGTDINTFIIMSALIHEGRIKMTARHLLLVGLKSLKALFKPSGLLLILYIVIVVPLVGIGFTIGPLEHFQIPKFITDVIFKNTLYSSLYYGLIIVMGIVSLLHVFIFHYMLLMNQSIRESFANARTLFLRHWKAFIVDFFGSLLLITLGIGTVFIVFMTLSLVGPLLITQNSVVSRVLTIFGMASLAEIIAFVTLMTVPFIASKLTTLFYRYNQKEGIAVKLTTKVKADVLGDEAFGKVKLRTKFALGTAFLSIIAVNIAASIFYTIFFNEIFRSARTIEIVAHRGGGDLAAENTILSLEEAIKANVAWSEIDVQRTKDGKYIINHDGNFARVAGESRTSSEMTLEEIKQLKVKDLFDANRPSQEVATIEEFLDGAKGRIGLFIELKGSTADKQMADDVIQMAKERNMLGEVALISLDYALIQYIEETYPEVQTGFLYFFSVGETAKMKGDILIMEEREATDEKVAEIQAAGKKAIVWTVNTEESIDKFVNSQVDGIITDYVHRVQDGVKRRDNRTDYEIILDSFLSSNQ